ncbi:hypothetical protein HH212_18610 [Massilia forsythiae]|uniref:Uncharacterized protein n=1 Tax=Massilia forsythiae TaxID=2728020 RepID=A0A7Z2VYU2_9BURK|nr:hypothetical protein [Massilia forsythiae]QJE01791.1 hypothetical protein HH212_18610 [Massilia forsythiae]
MKLRWLKYFFILAKIRDNAQRTRDAPGRRIIINLKDTIEKVLRKATSSRPYLFNVVTLETGKEVAKAGYKLKVLRRNDGYDVELVTTMPPVTTTALKMGPLYARAGMVSSVAFARTQYGNVTDDILFQKLYDVKKRWLMYIEAGDSSTREVWSAPCMICGLVLPMRNLTVDHQRPQSGGEIEAVLKTFRAFGLTMEGPRGGKGKIVLQHITAGAQLEPVLTRPGRFGLGGFNINDRYTLNDDGAVLYSFVVDAGEKALLQSQCMHGLMNLKPACQTCNSARGKELKFA